MARLKVVLSEVADRGELVTVNGEPLDGVQEVHVDMAAHDVTTVTVVFLAAQVDVQSELEQ